MDRESSLTDCPLIACLTGMWLQEFIVVSCNPPLQPPTLPRMNSPLSILTHDISAKANAKAGWSCSHSPSLQSYGLDEIRTHDPRASSTTLYQLSHQAILPYSNTKFQYVENRLSILYFNNMMETRFMTALESSLFAFISLDQSSNSVTEISKFGIGQRRSRCTDNKFTRVSI